MMSIMVKNRDKIEILKTNLLGKFVFISYFFLVPIFVNAQIVITEIMYDAEGSDTGKEWIEIFNDGDQTVNLSGWKLFEADINHKINPEEEEGGSLDLPSNSFGIIVNSVDKFRENYSSFSGIIFDSAYSLSNTGETLIIRDGDLSDVDNVTYSSDWGANGDGYSLQIIENDWVSANPTIGSANSSVSEDFDIEEDDDNTDSEDIIESSFFEEKQIYANAGKDKNVIVGADSMFSGLAFGFEDEVLKNSRYIWSFGDGNSGEGKNVLHNYSYPGEYVVVLNISSGEYSASDRIIVKALPVDIIISEVDIENNFIELYNKSEHELNLSWWRIKSGNEFFTLPRDTIILSNRKVKFSPQTIGLNINNINQIFLLYPNGMKAYYYDPYVLNEIEIVQMSSNSNQNSSKLLLQKYEPIVINQSLEDKKQDKEIDENYNEQLALIEGFEKNDNNLFNKWTLSLASLILISMTGVLFIKDEKQNLEPKEESYNPDDFKIID